jgi:hypothetical protein
MGSSWGRSRAYEVSPSIRWETQIASGLSAGISLKYVYVSLAPKEFLEAGEAGTGDTFAADLGLLYKVPNFDLPLINRQMIPMVAAVTVQNLGPDISFISEDQADPIGRNVRLGLASPTTRKRSMCT